MTTTKIRYQLGNILLQLNRKLLGLRAKHYRRLRPMQATLLSERRQLPLRIHREPISAGAQCNKLPDWQFKGHCHFLPQCQYGVQCLWQCLCCYCQQLHRWHQCSVLMQQVCADLLFSSECTCRTCSDITNCFSALGITASNALPATIWWWIWVSARPPYSSRVQAPHPAAPNVSRAPSTAAKHDTKSSTPTTSTMSADMHVSLGTGCSTIPASTVLMGVTLILPPRDAIVALINARFAKRIPLRVSSAAPATIGMEKFGHA